MKFLADFKVLSIACVIIALAFAGCIAYDLNGQSFDFSNSHPVLVVSDSMDGDVIGYDIDSFPSNTLVMVQELADYEKGFLREGDVIAYHNGSMLSVHRVVKVDDGYVYVHGDNNHSTEMISVADVEGRIVGASHILGEIASFIGGNVFLFLAVGFAICSVPIALRVYTAPRSQKCSGVPSRALTVVALLAVVAMVFVGVGAAYAASTENSGNTVTSEYVVLSQTSYSFTDDTLQYDVVTTELGTVYQLRGVTQLITIDGQMYYGVQVGDPDTLKAEVVGNDSLDVLDVTVNTLNTSGSEFTDFEGIYDWRYIMKIVNNNDSSKVQYVYYDGTGTDDLVRWNTYNPDAPRIIDMNSITGKWKVWGAGNASLIPEGGLPMESYKEGFLVLTDEYVGGLNGYTVITITPNVDSSKPPNVKFETNKSIGDTIAGNWKPWNRTVTAGSYTLLESTIQADSKKGFIILVDSSVSNLATNTVIGIPSTLSIQKDVQYDTYLYFAGVGETVNDGSVVKSVGKTVKFKSNSVISPVWVPSEESDLSNTLYPNYPENATKVGGGELTGQKRMLYFTKGSTLMLPENQYESEIQVGNDIYVFAGWHSDKYNKTYSPRYWFEMNEDREFKAVWEKASTATSVVFESGVSIIEKSPTETVPGSWLPWGDGTEGATYTVAEYPTEDEDLKTDAKEGFIVLIHKSVKSSLSDITVIKVESDGHISYETGKSESDTVAGSMWYAWNTIPVGDGIALSYCEAKNGFVVLIHEDYNITSGKYGIITIDWTGEMNTDYIQRGGQYVLPPNEFVREGKRFIGWKIDDPSLATDEPLQPATKKNIPESIDSVTLVAQWVDWDDSTSKERKLEFKGNIAFEEKSFYVYTDAEGKYLLPECFFGPEYELPDDTRGWKCIGWKIKAGELTGYKVAQSFTMPVGHESDQLVKNGTVKFIYDSEGQYSS